MNGLRYLLVPCGLNFFFRCCSEAEIYLFGGCITSWKVPSGRDLLFVRPDAVFNKKKPIRLFLHHFTLILAIAISKYAFGKLNESNV